MPMYDTRGRSRAIPDPLLTRISVGWSIANQQVGDVLFPGVRTNEKSGKYRVFGRESFAPPLDGTTRAPGGVANEIEGGRVSDDQFYATEHALKQLVTEEEVDEYSSEPDLNPRADATDNVTEKLILGRELAIHSLVTDPATYIPDHVVTLAGGEQFENHDTSEPVDVFRDLQRTFHRTLRTIPNLAIIPFPVMSWLEDHPVITSRYLAQGGVMTAQMIASLLGVSRVFVPGGGYNSTGNPARPDSISYLWDRDIVLAWVPPRPSKNVPAFGYEFWKPIRGQRRSIDRWWDDDHVSEFVRCRTKYDVKIVAKDEDTDKAIAGMLIKDAISVEALEGV